MRKPKHVKEPQIVEESIDSNAFPDLSDAIESLRAQLEDSSTERKNVIGKWLVQLESINKQMRHLERIENFSDALKNPRDSEGDDAWGENE